MRKVLCTGNVQTRHTAAPRLTRAKMQLVAQLWHMHVWQQGSSTMSGNSARHTQQVGAPAMLDDGRGRPRVLACTVDRTSLANKVEDGSLGTLLLGGRMLAPVLLVLVLMLVLLVAVLVLVLTLVPVLLVLLLVKQVLLLALGPLAARTLLGLVATVEVGAALKVCAVRELAAGHADAAAGRSLTA